MVTTTITAKVFIPKGGASATKPVNVAFAVTQGQGTVESPKAITTTGEVTITTIYTTPTPGATSIVKITGTIQNGTNENSDFNSLKLYERIKTGITCAYQEGNTIKRITNGSIFINNASTWVQFNYNPELNCRERHNNN